MGPLPRKKPKVRVRGAASASRAASPPEAASIPASVVAATETQRRLPVPPVSDADVTFGSIKHMPAMSDIPDTFCGYGNPYRRAVSTWFFAGAKREDRTLTVGGKRFTARPGIDARAAIAAIRSVLGSFQPSHEHKEAACAYMLSEWFEVT